MVRWCWVVLCTTIEDYGCITSHDLSTAAQVFQALQGLPRPSMAFRWVALGWARLGLAGLRWAGLRCAGLGWVALGWARVGWAGLGWACLLAFALSWAG